MDDPRPPVSALARGVIRRALAGGVTIVPAESCTAGLVADLLARIPGASRVLWGSYVCYTLEAKIRMLGIDPEPLRRFGAVSRETAEAMVRGALTRSGADLAVSVTGLAGPGGDGSIVPVGTVWIGSAFRDGEPRALEYRYGGGRNGIRRSAAREALKVLYRELDRFEIAD